ncbi:hypothetical protein HOF92_01210, partial [bacterium]|nr:hypothetical protein [bacterium]
IPFHELEPVLTDANEEVMIPLAQYAHLLGESEKVQICEVLLKHSDSKILTSACKLLQITPYPSTILKAILKLIPTRTEPSLLRELILSLQNHVHKLPKAFFQPLVRNQNRDIALATLYILAKNPLPSFRPLFQEGMASVDPQIRAASLSGLWKLGDPSLLELTKKETSELFVKFYTRALGDTGPDPLVQKALFDLCSHSNDEIRYEAVCSFGKVGSAQKIPDLILKAIEEPSLFICSAMMRTALILAEDETVRSLLNLVDLFVEVKDPDSLQKTLCLISMTPHYSVVRSMMESLRNTSAAKPGMKHLEPGSLDRTLLQEVFQTLESVRNSWFQNTEEEQQLTKLKPFSNQMKRIDPVNAFEFSSLLG